jgi:DNA-binding NarL/FixJ family response regulator
MQLAGAEGRMKRLFVVAESSLIVEAIELGLRNSGEFQLLGHVDARAGQVRAVVEAEPDVVLVDEMERSDEAITLIRQMKAAHSDVAVIVLATSMEPEWLDRIFAAGATGAISKFTHPGALATLVRETVNGHVVHINRSLGSAQSPIPSAMSAAHATLTARELEVLRLVADGSTNGDVARKLWVTEQTVKFHLSNVYRKLNIANRTEASRYAHLNGLVGMVEPSAV